MKKNTFWIICFLIIFPLAISISGCSGPHVYIHPNPGLQMIKRIAVLPFDNLTKDDKAGQKVRANFVIELLRTGSFDVMDTGEADRLLQNAELSYTFARSSAPAIGFSEPMDEETISSVPLSKEIGDTLKVQAIIVGVVEAYNTERFSDQNVPEVSISARLIDAETGIIVWGSTHTRHGGPGFPIFGWGKVTSLSKMSQKVIQDMVNALAEQARK